MYNPPRRDTWNLHYPYSDSFVSLYSDGHAEGMITNIPLAKLSNCPYAPLTFEKAWWSEGFYDAMQDRYAEYREKHPAALTNYDWKTELTIEAAKINRRVGDLVTNV